MKMREKGCWQVPAVLLFGVAAFWLRRQLYLTAVDGKGLLVRNTPLETGLLLLTVATLVLLLLILRQPQGSGRYEDNYSASILGALGHGVMALGILVTLRTGVPPMASYPGAVWQWLGYLAPVCLLLAGTARILGRKPFFALYVVPCLFFLVQAVNNYQLWSRNPQLQDYLFALLSILAMALFSYYTAAFGGDCGSSRLVRASGLATVYLCLAELGWTADPELYLAGAFWALTGMCRAEPLQSED